MTLLHSAPTIDNVYKLESMKVSNFLFPVYEAITLVSDAISTSEKMESSTKLLHE